MAIWNQSGLDYHGRNRTPASTVRLLLMIQTSNRPLSLLISLVALLLAYGIMNETTIASVLLLIMLFVVLVSATLQLSDSRRHRWPAFLLVLPTLGCFVVAHLIGWRPAEVLAFVLLTAFYLYTVVRLLSTIMIPGAVTRDHIYLALSVYMLLGFSWFSIYSLVEILIPGSLHSVVNEAGYVLNPGDRMYYSFVTLTTLGFGDIVPVKPLARILTVLEASAGVLYVGVLVARLVSSYSGVREK